MDIVRGGGAVLRPRVILADDHSIVLNSLSKLLQDTCDVIATASNGLEVVEAAQRLTPDVVVLDISMPELNGLEAARRIKAHQPSCRIIFLTMHGDPVYAQEAFQSGASGYLLKRSAASELNKAIMEVVQGRSYLTPLLVSDQNKGWLSHGPDDVIRRLHSLTPRQREVLHLIAEGKSIKAIAMDLHISTKTVEFHKAKIMERLDLRTTAALTQYAVVHGLAEV